MKEREFYGWVMFIFTFFMILFGRLASKPVLHSHSTPYASIAMKAAAPQILCFGDSLTAGMSPPLREYFPYAPHLESALRSHRPDLSILHIGYPGWTSTQLQPELQNTLVQQQPAPPSLAILLAGTNDLAYVQDPQVIAESIIALHQLSFQRGVQKTIAIGVPQSAYQAKYEKAAALAHDVNELLQQYCAQEPKAIFVPFPFGFDSRSDKWSPDGLHFSPRGYQTLGQSLAPIVQDILYTDDAEQQQQQPT